MCSVGASGMNLQNLPIERREAVPAPLKLGNEVELFALAEVPESQSQILPEDLRVLYGTDVPFAAPSSVLLVLMSCTAAVLLGLGFVASKGVAPATVAQTFVARAPVSEPAAKTQIEGELVKLQYLVENWIENSGAPGDKLVGTVKRVAHKGLAIEFHALTSARRESSFKELMSLVQASGLPIHLLVEYTTPMKEITEGSEVLRTVVDSLAGPAFLTRQGRHVTWPEGSSLAERNKLTLKLVVDKSYRGD